MSDAPPETAETAPQPGADIPNFAVAAGIPRNGEKTTSVTFGEPARTICFRKLDLVDQWDITELAGVNPSPRWLGMTLMAASVTNIDGIPVRPVITLTRDVLRERLKKIGSDGMNAIAAALEAETADAVEAVNTDAAKN
jgi:hypothetical protein